MLNRGIRSTASGRIGIGFVRNWKSHIGWTFSPSWRRAGPAVVLGVPVLVRVHADRAKHLFELGQDRIAEGDRLLDSLAILLHVLLADLIPRQLEVVDAGLDLVAAGAIELLQHLPALDQGGLVAGRRVD